MMFSYAFILRIEQAIPTDEEAADRLRKARKPRAFSLRVGLIRVVVRRFASATTLQITGGKKQSEAALFAVRMHLPCYEILKRHEEFNHNILICNYL